MDNTLIPIYTAQNGTIVGVSEGGKSTYDFRVRYREPNKHIRTPKHIHIIIDLYMKLVGDDKLTIKLVDHFIEDVILKIKSSKSYPPKLQIFQSTDTTKFAKLNSYGEYPVDFLLVTTELIQIQEKTNYPNGVINLELFKKFRNRAEIFDVVSAATFRGSA